MSAARHALVAAVDLALEHSDPAVADAVVKALELYDDEQPPARHHRGARFDRLHRRPEAQR